MSAINGAGLLDDPLPVQDSLFFKLQGAPEAVAATAHLIQRIASSHGSERFAFAKTDEEADALWMNRKYALNATLSSIPGSRCWTTDVCVPVSRLPELVYETKKDLASAGIKSTIVGHVGDGTLSPVNDPVQRAHMIHIAQGTFIPSCYSRTTLSSQVSMRRLIGL